MDLIGTLLGFAVLVAVVAIVARPLLAGPSNRGNGQRIARRSGIARQIDEHAQLLERRVAIYTAIRELDFDHETGKVSDDEHARQRAELVRDGVAVLTRLDQLEAAQAAGDPLEAAIAALRHADEAQAEVAQDAALEAAISGLRGTTAVNGNHTCPECGTPAARDDRFCGNCGAVLEASCAECGTPHQPGDLFCAHCGATLEAQG